MPAIQFPVPGHGRWRDACGVFGVFAPGEDVARTTYFGLFALQHRGQESAGIVVGDGHRLDSHVDLGLAFQVFDESIIRRLRGYVALGHVRYSTMGSNTLPNAQPIVGEGHFGPFAIAHNGNLVNAGLLRRQLEAAGVIFYGSSDTEVMAKLLELSRATTAEDAVAELMHTVLGAYSLGIITPDRLIAVRDPHGVRPLCIGQLNSAGWVIASETCALQTVGAEFVREIQPGEMVVIDGDGLHATQVLESPRRAMCIFEFIYFARPDSTIYGKNVYMARFRMGQMLARTSDVDADLVVPIPETGIPAAIGYAQESRKPFGEVLIKNRYIFRTFISPDQRMRELGVKMKLSPLKEVIAGRRLIVVDDSIVRGTTTKPEVELLRSAGAKEIHLRITCPPIRYPCFYGIDTSAGRSELIAARMSVEDIRKEVGADTLEYQMMANMIKAVGLPKLNFCTACFDGQYPIEVPPEVKVSKFDLERDRQPASE
ncbi:MAG: amidophosphoribosyltransferase [Armatimonadetes bacterium]|nr:amidophosphoribosyltransferase [Armatimonadota bacterium]